MINFLKRRILEHIPRRLSIIERNKQFTQHDWKNYCEQTKATRLKNQSRSKENRKRITLLEEEVKGLSLQVEHLEERLNENR